MSKENLRYTLLQQLFNRKSLFDLSVHPSNSDVCFLVFQVPLPLPIFMVLVSFFLVVAPFIEEILEEYLYGIAVIIFYLLLYFPFVYKRYRVPGISKHRVFPSNRCFC